MNKHPIHRTGQGRSLAPFSCNPTRYYTPVNIIPQYVQRDRNVAGQIKMRIHLKNARGEEMDIYQNQQILNLTNGAKGCWGVSENANHNQRRNRKHVYDQRIR